MTSARNAYYGSRVQVFKRNSADKHIRYSIGTYHNPYGRGRESYKEAPPRGETLCVDAEKLKAMRGKRGDR